MRHRIGRHLLALVLGLAACDGLGDGGPNGEGDVDADTDTDPEACCVHSGLRNVGGTWEWAFTRDHEEATGESGSWDSSLERDGETFLLSEDGHKFNDWTFMETWWHTVYEYTCDPLGVWLLHAETEYTYESATVEGEGWSQTLYDSPALAMPRHIDVATTWTQEATGIIESETSEAEFTYITDFAVVSGGSTTVPGGTFDTLKVEWVKEDETGAYRAAPGVGTVWTGDAEILAWTHAR